MRTLKEIVDGLPAIHRARIDYYNLRHKISELEMRLEVLKTQLSVREDADNTSMEELEAAGKIYDDLHKSGGTYGDDENCE